MPRPPHCETSVRQRRGNISALAAAQTATQAWQIVVFLLSYDEPVVRKVSGTPYCTPCRLHPIKRLRLGRVSVTEACECSPELGTAWLTVSRCTVRFLAAHLMKGGVRGKGNPQDNHRLAPGIFRGDFCALADLGHRILDTHEQAWTSSIKMESAASPWPRTAWIGPSGRPRKARLRTWRTWSGRTP